MKVLNIGTSEMDIIEKGLKLVEERKYNSYAVTKSMGFWWQEDIAKEEYEVSHVRTTRKLIKDQRLQELCERCLSYFWNEYQMTGDFGDLIEDMGIDDEKLIELFHEAGFEEE